MIAGFPQSATDVLDVIANAERSRKFVWTAGRVIKESALTTRLADLGSNERKLVLTHITSILKGLAAQGILERRGARQSIRYGDEIGFDYLRTPHK
ncbi:MAG TPA: hypothetical protein VF865_17295 [Acidobacteriaceae bacterium]